MIPPPSHWPEPVTCLSLTAGISIWECGLCAKKKRKTVDEELVDSLLNSSGPSINLNLTEGKNLPFFTTNPTSPPACPSQKKKKKKVETFFEMYLLILPQNKQMS